MTYKFNFALNRTGTYCNYGLIATDGDVKVAIFGGEEMSEAHKEDDFRDISVKQGQVVLFRKSTSLLDDVDNGTITLDLIENTKKELMKRVALVKHAYSEMKLVDHTRKIRYIQNGQEVLCLSKADYKDPARTDHFVPDAKLVLSEGILAIVDGQLHNVHRDKEGRLYYET